ncbi:hypothetical protein HXX29_05480 [Weissella confusa]|uniref:hypothetical protein n=1 Tax=Weissella confusa TaxID=1583 RepID=UPI00189D398F|nr:hypothetical protein [Weissella confusa]MBF7058265.1 hypothetical protein [Weissella confusa]
MNIESYFSGLERLQQNLEKVSNTTTLNQDDLFPDDWIQEHTKLNNWYEFVSLAPWEGAFDDENVSALRDSYVSENSNFSDWEEMVTTAATDSLKRSLFQ